jgi:hypothetical protein
MGFCSDPDWFLLRSQSAILRCRYAETKLAMLGCQLASDPPSAQPAQVADRQAKFSLLIFRIHEWLGRAAWFAAKQYTGLQAGLTQETAFVPIRYGMSS